MEDFKNLRVRDIMTRNPICVSTHTILESIRDIFANQSIHHLPVIDDHKKIQGIISWTDLALILDWATKFNLGSSIYTNEKLLNSLTAIDICSKEVFTVRPSDSLHTCYELFKMNVFKALPVITEEGYVIGIITTFDMLHVAYEDEFTTNTII